jgi:NADP-dependent aldehyde dehydrogenase
MSSINPVYVFPGALDRDAKALATQYVGSVTGSSGQLCTSPGLVFVPEGDAGNRFTAAVTDAISELSGQTMLSGGIATAWQHGHDTLEAAPDVELLGRGTQGPGENSPAPAVFSAELDVFINNPVLHEEIFGAASLVVRYKGIEDLIEATAKLEGQLTASLHITEDDYTAAAPLIPTLERKVGRIIVNGWPTGVEVGHAVVHGGPYPATSDAKTTSVGSLAIDRFLRPVAYQNFPDQLRPAPLQDANPWQVNRLINGKPEHTN